MDPQAPTAEATADTPEILEAVQVVVAPHLILSKAETVAAAPTAAAAAHQLRQQLPCMGQLILTEGLRVGQLPRQLQLPATGTRRRQLAT